MTPPDATTAATEAAEDEASRHSATVDALLDTAPSGSVDEELSRARHAGTARPQPPADAADDDALAAVAGEGALALLRRGMAATPELRQGLVFTMGMAVATALGRIAVPVLIQQTLDRGVLGPEGFRGRFVAGACAIAVAAIVGLWFLSRATYLRLVQTAERSLYGLRTRTFAHIHRLSIAEHTDTRRGALVARVTSDVETLAQFTQWGAINWIVNTAIVVGTTLVMLAYSWRLTVVALVVFVPLFPVLARLQRRQLAAYDDVRSAVGDTLSEVSEAVTGAAVVEAYGLDDRVRRRLRRAVDRQYRSHLRAGLIFAVMFPLGDVFGSVALASVAGVGALNGDEWGLSAGELVAFLFLVNLLLSPIAELSEVLDHTQTALAGWRKILATLAIPVEIGEPPHAMALPDGPLGIELAGVSFSYRDGPPVLRGIDLTIPAGTNVAVVGETGSGKSTLAKLLCRLADPTEGRVRVGGVDLREVGADSRHRAVRMVPQDGFLFDMSIADNVQLGRPGSDPAAVDEAFDALGLAWWVGSLGDGLDTPVGERGTNLSVGERQLVALARAQLASPGLLILDEATSAVDPETEQALAEALVRLARGRTVVSIAHRLSTAEAADLVLVFDAGRIVEIGHHAELVARDGVYAGLYRSWVGATRAGAHGTS